MLKGRGVMGQRWVKGIAPLTHRMGNLGAD